MNCSDRIDEMPSPLVSIIVPVYNVEELLYNCLMSVVYQTLADTEVIVVNDASPDNSQAIIDQFVAAFPDKVRCVVHDHNQGLAYARRTGLRCAKAPYVLFVDSDDFVSGDICEELLNTVTIEKLDMLYFPFLRYWEESGREERLYPPRQATNMLLRGGYAAFWGAMYRKDFLLEHEDIAFLPMQFEDAAATPALLSRTGKVGVYRKKNLYFYRYERKGSICAQQINERKMLDTFAADTIGLKNVTVAYQRDYSHRVIKRACSHTTKELSIYDYAVLHLKEIIKATSNYQNAWPQECLRTIERVRELPDEIRIPKIVYINGFIKDELKDFSLYLDEAQRAYLFNPDVRVLDENSCDMATLPQWVKDAGPHEWGLYFAVKEIAKRGGIYISPTVRVATSFNREAFRSAFFASGEEATILPCAFGGTPDSPLFNEILHKAGQEEPSIKFRGMADCMARAVIEAGGVHLDGSEEYGPKWMQLHILSFGDVFRSLTPEISYCTQDWSNFKTLPEEFLSVPQSLNDLAWRLAARRQQKNMRMLQGKAENIMLKNTQEAFKEAERALKRAENAFNTAKKYASAVSARDFEKKLKNIQNSKPYRLARWFYHLFPAGLQKRLWNLMR